MYLQFSDLFMNRYIKAITTDNLHYTQLSKLHFAICLYLPS